MSLPGCRVLGMAQLPAPQQLRSGSPQSPYPSPASLAASALGTSFTCLWLQTSFSCLMELSSFASWGACFLLPCFCHLLKSGLWFFFLGALSQACAVSDESWAPLPSSMHDSGSFLVGELPNTAPHVHNLFLAPLYSDHYITCKCFMATGKQNKCLAITQLKFGAPVCAIL